ncbi:MAG: glycosyltransferase family 4 protein [Thermodesulfobacteriota bacterium]
MRETFSGKGPILFLADLSLPDPRPLLCLVRTLLFENPESRLILSGDPGPCAALLTGAGFSRVRKIPRLPAVTAAADHESYARFLSRAGLFPPGAREILVTKEHPAFGYFGGIGSYAEEMQRLQGVSPPGIVYLGEGRLQRRFLPSAAQARKLCWIVPETFYPLASLASRHPADIALDLVRAACLYYPDLAVVEYQDCDAVGLRIAQARRAGLLPPGISTRCRCHGTTAYLENGYGQALGSPERLRAMSEEKASIELADIQSFPTAWIKGFYEESGYRLSPGRARLLRYPFAFPDALPSHRFQAADTVLFFGRRTAMKGFPLFVSAMETLLAAPGSRLQEIVVIGAKDPALARENRALTALASRVRVTELSPSRHEARRLLARLAPRAVCVICYRADNHPNCVLEAMAAGCPLVATRTGGIPELVPPGASLPLVPPDPGALARAVRSALDLPAPERQQIARDTFARAARAQERINFEHQRQAAEAATPAPSSNPPSPAPEPLFFRHPDATLLPGFFVLHYRYLAQNPDAACAVAFAESSSSADKHIFRPIGDGIVASFFENTLGHATAAINPDAMKRLGISCPDPASDLLGPDFFVRVLCAGGRIGVIPEVLSRYAPGTGPFALATENPAQNPLAAGISALPRFEATRLAALAANMKSFCQSPEWTMAAKLSQNPRLLFAARKTLGLLSAARTAAEKIKR